MNIRNIFFFIFFVYLSCNAQENNPQPNIILLMGDDHGWEETGYNGHPFVKTPVLDEMAQQGLRLDRFHAAAPVCSPTRMSVLTGRHPNRSGTFVPNFSIRPEEITIAHLLAQLGYRCGHFGKWHLGPVKADSPTNPGAMGFHEWLSHDNFFELDPVFSRNGATPKQFKGESSKILVDHTIDFIESSHSNSQPFLAVIWFGSPHEPYQALPEDLALYNDLPDHLADSTVVLTSLETGEPTERSLREVLKERYAEITAMDRAIGILRTYIAENAMRDNTMIWYCGDNGIPSSGYYQSTLRGLKGSIYDGGTRVPGVIEWPKIITNPIVSDVNSVTSDILPTICAMVDMPLPERPLDGVNLLQFFEGSKSSRHKPIYFWGFNVNQEVARNSEPYIDPLLQEGTTPLVKIMNGKYTRSFRNFHHPQIEPNDFQGDCAVLDGDFKLVVRKSGTAAQQVELFDVHNDPSERRDILKDQKDRVKKMHGELREWQQSVLHSLTGADY